MKRNTKRTLSLLLTLVMLLGAVPFAAAAETATAAITADPGTTVWEGTSVDLLLEATGGTTENEVWTGGYTNVDSITVTPTETTTYSVEYNFVGASEKKTATKQITVKTTAKAGSFKINESAAIVGEALTLTASGAGDSDITWKVEKGTSVVSNTKTFTPDAAGTYKVTAVATNDPAVATDDVTVTADVVASVATYKVTMEGKTIALNNKTTKMSYTAKKGSETVTGTPTYEVTTGSAYVTVNASSGLLTPVKAGEATVKVTVAFADGETASATAKVTVTDSGVITMAQDGEVIDDDDSIDLDFEVVGPDNNDDVEWVFEVSALNIKNSTDKSSPYFTWKDSKETDKREYEVEEEGSTIKNVELVAKKGYGIAMITASANWTGGSKADATGTFYVSFYDDVNIVVEVKDGVDEFDFDEEDVFSAVTVGSSKYTATQLKTANLAEILTLDAGIYIDLDEGSKTNKNEDVGKIECGKSSLSDYDPDEVNTYEMEDLEHLTFEVDDEGTYQIDYVQYDTVSGYSKDMLIGEGTLKIVVGDASATTGDIDYAVKNKGEVTLDEDDFEEFWEDYCDDEDINEDFGYVIFEGYKATSIYGALYAEDGDKNMNASYKFHFDYDDDEDDGSKDYDLTEVIYEASSTKTNYVDEIDFTCYSDDGKEEVEGTLTFTVGEGEEEEEEPSTMNFTDVKTTDWFYDAVSYVYSNEIMAGTSTTKFEPNTKLSRAMVVTMLWRLEGEPSVITNSFTDVKDTTSWYFKAVSWAAKNGIVNGVTDTTFAPNTNITREQLAAILYRYADYKNKDTAATKALTGYPDASRVSSYATTAMKWAVTQGIISGDNAGKLNPQGTATRAEAATMFQRFLAES